MESPRPVPPKRRDVGIGLPKTREQMAQVLLGNAYAGVMNGDADQFFVGDGFHRLYLHQHIARIRELNRLERRFINTWRRRPESPVK